MAARPSHRARPSRRGGPGRRVARDLTADMLLAMTLWQAARTRADEMGSCGTRGARTPWRAKISQLIWGRLSSPDGSSLVSLVEATRLCDAIVAALRTRLSFDPNAADEVARFRGLRAELARCDDLAGSDTVARGRVEKLRGRWTRLRDKASVGADVTGPLTELEAEVARTERDLIVGASERRELARDRKQAVERYDALEAREPRLRDLAARCRREIAAPRGSRSPTSSSRRGADRPCRPRRLPHPPDHRGARVRHGRVRVHRAAA
ncbi:hypothetical protein NKG05_02005 [Oerskovia sp. M15]